MIPVTVSVFFVFLLLAGSGCQPSSSPSSPLSQTHSAPEKLTVYRSYSPTKIQILPLTEFVIDKETQEFRLRVYLSLLDSFGSQKKSPGIFRFELYPHISRSGEQKGRRIIMWPDINLTNAAENNKYWKDFLRAYKFSFDFEPAPNQTYILQVTYLCPDGKRLSHEYEVKPAK
jgi:hypothetical protein